MMYIGAEATIKDCWIGTDKHKLFSIQSGHIDTDKLQIYTKVLDWEGITDLLTELGYSKENVVQEYGSAIMIEIRYKMQENVSGTLDNMIIVQYEIDKKIRTVMKSDRTILDTDNQEIRKSILSAEEIEREIQREQGKAGK